jgi:uncharacterized membrane protein
MTDWLAFFWQMKILPPSDVGTWVDITLRWIHFVAGITWIGLLYFFNLVNVPAMKAFDAPTKGKYLPNVVAPALWLFRWGAVATVLAGFLYWFLLLGREPQPPDGEPGQHQMASVGLWLLYVAVTWVLNYLCIKKVPAVAKNGWVLAAIVFVLIAAFSFVIAHHGLSYPGVSNRVVSIGVGGGYGVFMLLNVWGIIWPAQKRILEWTKENAEKGTAIPPESAVLARRAFLASRTNTWLSLPMLFFMAAASHFPLFTGG